MATHDYVISNASGAAVRADLNNALAAIVSNNSNATEPSTTYAYQWWADIGSSPAVMKLRNATNDGWIELFQLDGEWSTIALEDGTAAAPSLYFKDSGTDTGLFSGGTDQVNITTGGTERVEWGTSEVVFNDGGENYDFRIEGDTNANLLFVDASTDRVGIGTSSPSYLLDCKSTGATNVARFLTGAVTSSEVAQFGRSDQAVNLSIDYDGAGSMGIGTTTAHPFNLKTGAVTRATIDASGRLLVGTSTARTDIGSNQAAVVQVESTTAGLGYFSAYNQNNAFGSVIGLAKSRGTTVGSNTIVQSGDQIGGVFFYGADGVDTATAGSIECYVDGTPGANDMPGRLVFSTTVDGASSPTERMRIRSTGHTSINGGLLIGGTSDPGSAIYISGSVLSSGAGNSTLKYNSNSGLVTYDASSRLVKEDIVNCPYGIEQIKQLLPRKYFRTDDQREEIGFVADELANVMPEFVSIGPKSIITKDENDIEEVPLGVYYEKLTAVLTKALQEAIDKIETLEAKVAALEGASPNP